MVSALAEKGVSLVTTEHHAVEFLKVLTMTFGVPEPAARIEVENVLGAFWVLASGDYEACREQAERRLSQGGKSDWPALAAALSHDGSIWSDDRDFFGVGVPVWSTSNVHLAPTSSGTGGPRTRNNNA